MEIVSGSPGKYWDYVDCNDNSTYVTLYVGQAVKTGSDGVVNLSTASGAYDATGESMIVGVVLGTNLYKPSYSATSKSNSITSENAHTNTTERRFGEGFHVRRGDKRAMVEVGIITTETVLRAKVYNSTIGTALTLLTVTTGSTDGTGFTSNATQHTPVADMACVYGLSGANAGVYAPTKNTSTTVHATELYFPSDIAIGDTFVGAPFRLGNCLAYFDSNALFLDGSAALTTNYFGIRVVGFDLSNRANAWIDFMFNPMHLGVRYRGTT